MSVEKAAGGTAGAMVRLVCDSAFVCVGTLVCVGTQRTQKERPKRLGNGSVARPRLRGYRWHIVHRAILPEKLAKTLSKF
jgi:hypothetical protein